MKTEDSFRSSRSHHRSKDESAACVTCCIPVGLCHHVSDETTARLLEESSFRSDTEVVASIDMSLIARIEDSEKSITVDGGPIA